MTVPSEIIRFIRSREGWRTSVYADSRGNPTVGMGHLLSPGERSRWRIGDTVPELQLEQWAREDSMESWRAAISQARELGLESNAPFVTVLTSVNFQLGTHWRDKFQMTWMAMEAGRWEDAARMVRSSRWASQTPVRAGDFATMLESLARAGGGRKKAVRAVLGAAIGGAIALLLAALAATRNLGHN